MVDSFSSSIAPLTGAIQVNIADAGRNANVAIVRCYSTSFRARACVFAASCLVLIGIGAFFTIAGAWPVFIFSMLQAALLARIWSELELHADDRDFVTIEDEAVEFEAVCRKRAK